MIVHAVVLAATKQSQPDQTPAWWALAIAILSLAATIVLGFFTIRSGLWRRRAKQLAKFEAPFNEVKGAVNAGHQSAANVGQLWTPAVMSSCDYIRDHVGELPDRSLRKKLSRFHALALEARGTERPPATGGTTTTLPMTQARAMDEAFNVVTEIEKRMTKVKRSGGE